jgi:hypothetical protein
MSNIASQQAQQKATSYTRLPLPKLSNSSIMAWDALGMKKEILPIF